MKNSWTLQKKQESFVIKQQKQEKKVMRNWQKNLKSKRKSMNKGR